MRYFIRIRGELFQVRPLTHPSARDTSVKVRIIRTDSIKRVLVSELILDY